MKRLTAEIVKKHFQTERLVYSMMGALLFVFVGWAIPDIYFKYFDKTEYISVIQPVYVNQEVYRRGDDVAVTIIRTSLIDTHGSIIVQLHLVYDDNKQTKYPLSDAKIAIAKSDKEVFYQKYKIPETINNEPLPLGIYHIEAVISYSYKGLPKTYSWKSNSFTVSEELSE